MVDEKLMSTARRAGAFVALTVGLVVMTGCKGDEPGPSEVKLQANPYKKMMEDHNAGKSEKPSAGAPGGAAPAGETPTSK